MRRLGSHHPTPKNFQKPKNPPAWRRQVHPTASSEHHHLSKIKTNRPALHSKVLSVCLARSHSGTAQARGWGEEVAWVRRFGSDQPTPKNSKSPKTHPLGGVRFTPQQVANTITSKKSRQTDRPFTPKYCPSAWPDPILKLHRFGVRRLAWVRRLGSDPPHTQKFPKTQKLARCGAPGSPHSKQRTLLLPKNQHKPTDPSLQSTVRQPGPIPF